MLSPQARPSLLRRCRHLMLEPVELTKLEAQAALEGRIVPCVQRCWKAWAAHLDAAIELEPELVPLLLELPVEAWTPASELVQDLGMAQVDRLLAAGVLLGCETENELPSTALRDQDLRAGHWWTPAAVAYAGGCWRGVDATGGRDIQVDTASAVHTLGPPPPAVSRRLHAGPGLALPRPEPSCAEAVLGSRRTCRNFDAGAVLPLEVLAAVLHDTFGARGSVELAPGAVALKKLSPSGGGLHPVEAFVIAQRVDTLAPGPWHYDCLEHCLRPLPGVGTAPPEEWVLDALAGQEWFHQAPALVVMVARFERGQWKYRNHAKALRVALLDAGHLGQTLALSATTAGLGVFLTAAVNEHPICDYLGLRFGREGVVAVCGIGPASVSPHYPELDARGLTSGG